MLPAGRSNDRVHERFTRLGVGNLRSFFDETFLTDFDRMMLGFLAFAMFSGSFLG